MLLGAPSLTTRNKKLLRFSLFRGDRSHLRSSTGSASRKESPRPMGCGASASAVYKAERQLVVREEAEEPEAEVEEPEEPAPEEPESEELEDVSQQPCLGR